MDSSHISAVAQVGCGDSSGESGVVAGVHEQADPSGLQYRELAGLQRNAQAPLLADDPVRSRASYARKLVTL